MSSIQRTYHAYGSSSIPFRWLTGELAPPEECMIVGQAGTGKSTGVAKFLWAAMDMYPDLKVLVVRKTRVSLNESFLDTFENDVLWPGHPSLEGATRAHRDKYEHPNGAEMVLGGMDNPTKLFSTQYHIIFVNECTELLKREWVSLHRALRRPGGPGWHMLIGDTNPDAEHHWLNKRFPQGNGAYAEGRLRLISFHRDNPTITQSYIDRLEKQLKGTVMYDRLFLGLWRTAEGLVYSMWNPDIHLVSAEIIWPRDAFGEVVRGEAFTLRIRRGLEEDDYEDREIRWCLASQDFGYAAPGSLSVWGFDSEKRAYRLAQVYRAGKDLDWWAEWAAGFYAEFRFRQLVCDSAEPRSIKHMNDHMSKHGMPRLAVPVDKPTKKGHGFNHVRWCLSDGEDGKGPRALFVRDALRGGRDPDLDELGLPCCSEEEIGSLRLRDPKETEKGELAREESDEGCADHGMDEAMYCLLHAWRKDLSKRKDRAQPVRSNFDVILNESADTLMAPTRRMGL